MYTLTFPQGNTFTDEYKSTTEITVVSDIFSVVSTNQQDYQFKFKI